MHRRRKELLIDYARQRLRHQYLRQGASPGQSDELEHVLNVNALTIGFARRFTTYKRATLILRDLDRLGRILNNPERPVQIIFAGKAHPADEPGKALVEQVYHLSRSDEFRCKIIFLENYDIEMACYLVSGADLWLNNPIRPYEASSTSGQKAALNGLPNCSILDGWWAEGYNGKNGWEIGEEREYDNDDERDKADSQSLYALLKGQIIPTYYDRGSDGIPHGWIAIMKEAIRTCAPAFSTRRMVKEYTTHFYVSEIRRGTCIEQNHYQQARELAAWEDRIRRIWSGLMIIQPDTLLRWHRQLFRLVWKRRSKAASHQPRVAAETVALIREMAAQNRLWGAERIRGELLKLGLQVCKRTIQKYIRRVRPPQPRGQKWSTFLRTHASAIWACDFLQVTDLFFRPLFAFFLIERKDHGG